MRSPVMIRLTNDPDVGAKKNRVLEAYENTGWQGRTEDLAHDYQRPRRSLRTALTHGDGAFLDDAGVRLGRRTLDMTGPGVVLTLIG